MAPVTDACDACGKSGDVLLRCGQCKKARFCNRECQVLARQRGHKGANCRPPDAVQQSPPFSAAPSDMARLFRSYSDLVDKGAKATLGNTRLGYLAAVASYTEAASAADLIGGQMGAELRADADQSRTSPLLRLGDNAAAARAACSVLRSARAAGSRTMLVKGLGTCGEVAKHAPGEMADAERESREQGRLSVSPSYGGLDLSQEGRIILPTTPAALSRLALAYNEAAVTVCDNALTASGGRGSPAAADPRRVPELNVKASSRGRLAACLHTLGEEERSFELFRQAVALRRHGLRTAEPGRQTLTAQCMLADQLCTLGMVWYELVCFEHRSEGMVEAEAYMREALELGEGMGDVRLAVKILTFLVNFCGEEDAAVTPAEAEAFRLRLNQLLVQMGRETETNCSICLEPLAPPADGTADDAATAAVAALGIPKDSCVRVMACHHQFHDGCIMSWRETTSNLACPLCKL